MYFYLASVKCGAKLLEILRIRPAYSDQALTGFELASLPGMGKLRANIYEGNELESLGELSWPSGMKPSATVRGLVIRSLHLTCVQLNVPQLGPLASASFPAP